MSPGSDACEGLYAAHESNVNSPINYSRDASLAAARLLNFGASHRYQIARRHLSYLEAYIPLQPNS